MHAGAKRSPTQQSNDNLKTRYPRQKRSARGSKLAKGERSPRVRTSRGKR